MSVERRAEAIRAGVAAARAVNGGEGRWDVAVVDAVVRAVVPFMAPPVGRDQIARVIDPEAWRYFDSGILPAEHPGAVAVVRRSRAVADRVLALFPVGDES